MQTRRTKDAGPTELAHDVKIVFQFPAPNEDYSFPSNQENVLLISGSHGYHSDKYFVGRLIGIRDEDEHSAQKAPPVSNKLWSDARALNENIGLALFAVSAKLDAIGRPLAVTVFESRMGIAFIGPHSRLGTMSMDTKEGKHMILD